ncbi:hypothetical protein Lal_00047902 [Lupinus albus]|nr:hypothetical protein Lal_00047902 [Lupinus albus]
MLCIGVEELHCEVGSIPFKFLGILVGANLRRLFTWSHIIDSFKKKHSLSKYKLLSFSVRVTLINSERMLYRVVLFVERRNKT